MATQGSLGATSALGAIPVLPSEVLTRDWHRSCEAVAGHLDLLWIRNSTQPGRDCSEHQVCWKAQRLEGSKAQTPLFAQFANCCHAKPEGSSSAMRTTRPKGSLMSCGWKTTSWHLTGQTCRIDPHSLHGGASNPILSWSGSFESICQFLCCTNTTQEKEENSHPITDVLHLVRGTSAGFNPCNLWIVGTEIHKGEFFSDAVQSGLPQEPYQACAVRTA